MCAYLIVSLATSPANLARVAESVLSQVAETFRKCLEVMVEGANKTEASLRRVKKIASSSARGGASSDLAKIIGQVRIDVDRFVEDAGGAASLAGIAGVPAEVEELRQWAARL